MKVRYFALLITLLLFGFFNCGNAQQLHVSKLKTEYLRNPVGIDMPHPRFSWVIHSNQRGVRQSAFQIQVAKSTEELTGEEGWDTGKTQSEESVNVSYDGKMLESDQSYYWRVKVWSVDGKESAWSSVQTFHTGLMKKSDWAGRWIGAPDTTISSPLLRREFDTDKEIESAHIFVSGLGYYELYLNGQKVGNHKLDPGTSNYYKRALYASYDVSDYLKDGGNALGVWLGNGYFRMRRDQAFRYYGDRPQMILQLNIKYTDSTESHIVSNSSWKASASPITENNVYDGEVYDARREQSGWDQPGFDDTNWAKAATVDVPETRKLSAQLMPPITVTETQYPVSMSEPEEGVYVFDFGQNLTGWPRITVDGGEGQHVVIKTSEVTRKRIEQMKGNSTLGIVDTIDTRPNRSAKAREVYILSGKAGKEVYEPRFTYHGFRYIQVEGLSDEPSLGSIVARVAHTNVNKTGSFKSSNSLFNKIHENTLWGQRSNLFSIPTDCPQRDERMGWMADADLSAEEAMLNFDMAAFYTNWLRLIQDGQNEDGSVPDFVPAHKWRDFSPVGTPAWQVAYPLITWYMYQYYGDTRVLNEHYKSLDKWMDYMASIADDYIVTRGRGDWVPPERGGAPGDGSIALTSTGYYYQSAEIMKHIAGILGRSVDEQKYELLAMNIRNAFNKRFWNTDQQTYGTGSQTSNIFPLSVGLVPEQNQEKALGRVLNDIQGNHGGKIWTGIIGTKALVDVLADYGKGDLLYDMANRLDYPGWGYMIARGASTIWERWGGYRYFGAGMNSLNHIMFGSIDEYFYKNLAGIQSAAPGFDKIVIRPSIFGGSDFEQASLETIHGKIFSAWHRQGNSIKMDVTIPANTTAMVSIPKAGFEGPYKVRESRQVIWDGQQLEPRPGIESAREDDGYIIFEVGSGTYSFELTGE